METISSFDIREGQCALTTAAGDSLSITAEAAVGTGPLSAVADTINIAVQSESIFAYYDNDILGVGYRDRGELQIIVIGQVRWSNDVINWITEFNMMFP